MILPPQNPPSTSSISAQFEEARLPVIPAPKALPSMPEMNPIPTPLKAPSPTNQIRVPEVELEAPKQPIGRLSRLLPPEVKAPGSSEVNQSPTENAPTDAEQAEPQENEGPKEASKAGVHVNPGANFKQTTPTSGSSVSGLLPYLLLVGPALVFVLLYQANKALRSNRAAAEVNVDCSVAGE